MIEYELKNFVLIIIISTLFTYILARLTIKFCQKNGLTVIDYHKITPTKVSRFGGIPIFGGIFLAEVAIYYITKDVQILTLILVISTTFLIGIIDDIKKLGGIAKPIMLIFASIPILFFGTYHPGIEFPFFGAVRLNIIYPILILIAITVTANTMNTIDVLNGTVSGFTMITTTALLIALILTENSSLFMGTLPMLFSVSVFYLYHKHPSKIFPGDSGTLTLGAMFGAIAIIGNIEIIGVVALLPAIMNSFFYLYSVRGLVEHTKLAMRPTRLLEDEKIVGEKDKRAPVTLVRLLTIGNPLTEKKINEHILILSLCSTLLAIITAVVMWY